MEKQGTVIKSTGSWYIVKSGKEEIACRIRGKFRIDGIRSTNPVAVGDHVLYQTGTDEQTAVITAILPRKNHIIRRSTNLSKKSHILAANVDQAILLATIARPKTEITFIDRFLVSAEAYSVPVRIVFNKTDIYSPKQLEKMHEWMKLYQQIGYEVYAISAAKNENLESIVTLLKNQISLIAGISGVGKSTLINHIDPELSLRTAGISDSHNKGKHTTTFAEMFELRFGGMIIDTPGIKAFGLVDFDKNEIAHYFPEMFKYLKNCQFHNCTHIHEPGCAVKSALERGEISESRYMSYLKIVESDDEGKYREDIYK